MIKNTALIAGVFTAIMSSLGYYQYGLEQGLSIFIGGFTMIINLVGLSLIWLLVFNKKSIALAVIVIIFKYLILGLILWGLASLAWLKLTGFLIGMSSLLFAILLTTLQRSVLKL